MNYDIISFIHFVSFADLFGKKYSSTTIEHLSHYFKHRKKMSVRQKEQVMIVIVRLLALEQEKKKTLEVTLGILC
jgi:hypothetical protein